MGFTASQEFLILTMAVSGYVVYRLARLIFASRLTKRRAVKNASLLLSYYSNARQLMGIHNIQAEDLNITFFVTYGELLESKSVLERLIQDSSDGVAMASVHLPFKTSSHLLGITQEGGRELGLQEFLARRELETIELEGDFPSDFLLYAPPGNQFNARYVFDPKAMAFVVDFCKSHHFEVVGDMLYIAENRFTGLADTEQSFSIDSIKQFVKEIKPALIKEEDKTSFTPERYSYRSVRADIKCPRCAKPLQQRGDFYECQGGHGLLISGPSLIKLKKTVAQQRMLTQQELAVQPKTECPNCHKTMQAVNYQQTGIVIDACLYCGYRWLDHGEDVLILK